MVAAFISHLMNKNGQLCSNLSRNPNPYSNSECNQSICQIVTGSTTTLSQIEQLFNWNATNWIDTIAGFEFRCSRLQLQLFVTCFVVRESEWMSQSSESCHLMDFDLMWNMVNINIFQCFLWFWLFLIRSFVPKTCRPYCKTLQTIEIQHKPIETLTTTLNNIAIFRQIPSNMIRYFRITKQILQT